MERSGDEGEGKAKRERKIGEQSGKSGGKGEREAERKKGGGEGKETKREIDVWARKRRERKGRNWVEGVLMG